MLKTAISQDLGLSNAARAHHHRAGQLLSPDGYCYESNSCRPCPSGASAAEGQHDVFRPLAQEQLDRVRIRSVAARGRQVTIEADLAAAYTAPVAPASFRRTFVFDGPSTFTITDEIALDSPRQVVWHLQSDTPFRPWASSAGQSAPGRIKAPGPPGSIETGPEEERGHVLTGSTSARRGSLRIEAVLRVVPPAQD